MASEWLAVGHAQLRLRRSVMRSAEHRCRNRVLVEQDRRSPMRIGRRFVTASPPNSKRRHSGTEVKSRLGAIAKWHAEIIARCTGEPSIANLSWENVAPLFALAYGIKRGNHPVFASKMCHFMFPRVFVVIMDQQRSPERSGVRVLLARNDGWNGTGSRKKRRRATYSPMPSSRRRGSSSSTRMKRRSWSCATSVTTRKAKSTVTVTDVGRLIIGGPHGAN